MTLSEIPGGLNSWPTLTAAKHMRDAGLAVVPFHRGKKTPAIKGWPTLTVADCDDAFIARWWGGAKDHDLSVLVAAPLIIIDIDGPGDPEIAVAWLEKQPALTAAPYEVTSRGIHIWIRCGDMPAEVRDRKCITTHLSGGIRAEIFVKTKPVRMTPSKLSNGQCYAFARTGEIPEIGWSQLIQIFSIPAETRKPGRPKKDRPNAWKVAFQGDLATLDIVRLGTESKHLVIGDPLDDDAMKHPVRCPWNAEHSKPAADGGAPESDTAVLLRPGQPPVFRCLHATCAERRLKDLLLWVEQREPGLVDRCCSKQRPVWIGEGGRAPDGRPCILLPGPGRAISEFAAEAGAAVGPAKVWFFKAGSVVRVEEIRVGAIEYLGFHRVAPPYGRSAIERFVQPGILNKDRDTEEPVFAAQSTSTDLMAALLVAPAFTGQLAIIDRVLDVAIPMRLPKGGYDLPVEGYDPRFRTTTVRLLAVESQLIIRIRRIFWRPYFAK